MVKGKSKGSDAFEESLAEKSYKSGIQEVIKLTPVQPGDFDAKAFRLLDALNEKGRAGEACDLLKASLQGVQRKRITNWRGYVYSLIRKVDEEVYHEMKESKEKEKENGSRRRSRKAEEPASGASKKEFNKGASEFVPGKLWNTESQGKTLRKEAATFVPTAQALQPLFPAMPEAWAGPKAAPKGKSAPMKPDAQEFFPGVSAWAGAMVMNKGNGKAKVKPKAKAKKAGLVPQPVSPGLQTPSDASPTSKVLSDACQEALATVRAPGPRGPNGELRGFFNSEECLAILEAAKHMGLEQSLVSKDPWLAANLWQRLRGVQVPGKTLMGVEQDLVVHVGERAVEGMALQVCLACENLQAGDAYIRSAHAPQAAADGSWLTAGLRCADRTRLDQVQELLSQKRCLMAVVGVTAAVALLVPLLRRRLKQ